MRTKSIIMTTVLSSVLCGSILAGAEVGDRDPMGILQDMAGTIADAKQFSVTIRSNYDVLQADGQEVQFGAERRVQVRRPDGLRVETQRSDGERSLLLFDGEQILICDLLEKVHATVEKAGSVDEAIKHVVGVLNIPLPLARLLRTTLSEELEQRVEEVRLVEVNRLTDVPTDHLAVRTEEVDFQIWITQGAEPLPRRIVITYKNIEGSPQFRADFSNWNLSGNDDQKAFECTPPANSELIPLLVRDVPGADRSAQEESK